ncbi:DUF1850 domain-containing protein [Bacillus sp. FSL W7-1360]
MKRIIIWVLLPLLLLLCIFFYPVSMALVFYNEDTNERQAFLPLEYGDEFQIIFTHSVHLSDVVEKYRVTSDKQIEQFEFIFEEFGVGMPSNAQTGETFVYEEGRYHIRDMKNLFPELRVRNGKAVSQHRLVWGTHEVTFNDYMEPGAWMTLKIEDLTLWQWLKGARIHEQNTN